MKSRHFRIPCMIIRGGTSRGLYFYEPDLPADEALRVKLFLRIMGSPDLKQIDGLGGAASVTSKIAVVGPSLREDADVDYTFYQVSVDKPLVSTKGNCGNISSGVGPFAIEKGMVPLREPMTHVRIFNTNTEKIIVSDVMCSGGHVEYTGDFSIAGVPGTAAPVCLHFVDPAGTLKQFPAGGTKLLPTGNAVDILEVPNFGPVHVSIVDAANPLVFAIASELGMTGSELPKEIDNNPELLALLELVRGMAACRLGLIDAPEKSAWETPGIPKMTIVSPAAAYKTVTGETIPQNTVDLRSRMMSMQKAHPTYAMTGAMCTAAAAAVPGSVVAQVLAPHRVDDVLRIGHPGGVLEAGSRIETAPDGTLNVLETYGFRTANLLMEGYTHCNLEEI